jgi:hypothetical protein
MLKINPNKRLLELCDDFFFFFFFFFYFNQEIYIFRVLVVLRSTPSAILRYDGLFFVLVLFGCHICPAEEHRRCLMSVRTFT